MVARDEHTIVASATTTQATPAQRRPRGSVCYLRCAKTAVTFRLARKDDLPALLQLLASDEIARDRAGYNTECSPGIVAAFEEIQSDPNNELWVGEREGELIATLQLTFIPGLSRGGMRRALVEAVRVREDLRGQRIGEQLMQRAMDRARERGCGMIQLTTDLRREAAHKFYLRLGFIHSHAGMKRML